MDWPEQKLTEAHWLIDSLEASARRRARLKFSAGGSGHLITVLDVANRELKKERRRTARVAKKLTGLLPGGKRRLALRVIRYAYLSERALLSSMVLESCGAETKYVEFIVAQRQQSFIHARRAALDHVTASLGADNPGQLNQGSGH